MIEYLTEINERYDLILFRHEKIRNIQSSDVRLEKMIEVPGHMLFKEGLVVNYSCYETLYFGKGLNLQTGDSVRVTFVNGTQINIEWGLPIHFIVWHKIRLFYSQLPPVVTIKAAVLATSIERKMDYTATLVAHYQAS